MSMLSAWVETGKSCEPAIQHLSLHGKSFRRAHEAVICTAESRGDDLPCNAARREGKTAGEGAAKEKQGKKAWKRDKTGKRKIDQKTIK